MQRVALPYATGYAGFSNELHRPMQRATFSNVPRILEKPITEPVKDKKQKRLHRVSKAASLLNESGFIGYRSRLRIKRSMP